jgi:transcriptional regulator with XRE-family HTH domain
MSFYETLSYLMKKRNVTAKQLSEKLKIGKNQFKYWKDNGNIPNGETLISLADYFDCSVDYLLGISDDPSRAGKSLNNLSANELTIIELFGSLSDTQQGELIGRAKMMVEQNESAYQQEGTG